ncbi:MAG: DinB family protein [Caldilineales bacterium]|nr:DinB family protein [Caldilineales bacterium]
MDSIALLKTALDASHRWYLGTVDGLTEAQANFVPPGTAHPIGELAAHILQSEDGIVNMLQGQPPLWVRDGWGERLGLPMVMRQDPEVARAFRCQPGDLADYGQAVYANTEAFLSGLRPDDLDRDVDLSAMGIGTVKLGYVLTGMLLGNTFAHTGEISALKGVQGLRGYPF